MTTTHTTADIHQEKVFEAHIVAWLTAEQGCIERNCAAHYDVAYALDTELLVRFLKATQPETWQTLEDQYRSQAEAEVLKRLEQALKLHPAHVVLRGEFLPAVDPTEIKSSVAREPSRRWLLRLPAPPRATEAQEPSVSNSARPEV